MDPEYGGWKKTVTPFNMSNWHYKESLTFNKYVESMPEDFRRATFDSVGYRMGRGERESRPVAYQAGGSLQTRP